MRNQRKITRTSAYAGITGILLSVLLPFLFGATGAIATLLSVVYFAAVIAAAVGLPVCLGTWIENGKKPGSTPLIYGVIAIPVGFVLMMMIYAFQSVIFTGIPGLILFLTGIAGIIIGIVKKLSVSTVTSA